MPVRSQQLDADCNGGPLLLNANKAAELLGISRKTLWNHTSPRGLKIPAVRIGRVVRYRRETLERWLEEHESVNTQNAGG